MFGCKLLNVAEPPLQRDRPGTLRRRGIDWSPTDRVRAHERLLRSSAKELIELGIRHQAGEAVELAFFGDFGRRFDEGLHGDARQRATDADAAHAKPGEILDSEAERTAVEEVDWLRCDRLDRRRDLLARLNARGIEAIGTGVGEGLEAADGFIEIGPAVDESFGAGGEHHIAAGFVDCLARRAHALDRQIEVVKRIGVVAGEVLDRHTGDARLHAQPHIRRHRRRDRRQSRPRNRRSPARRSHRRSRGNAPAPDRA